MLKLLGKANIRGQIFYNAAAIIIGNILFRFICIRWLWVYILAAILLSFPVNGKLQDMAYRKLIAAKKQKK